MEILWTLPWWNGTKPKFAHFQIIENPSLGWNWYGWKRVSETPHLVSLGKSDSRSNSLDDNIAEFHSFIHNRLYLPELTNRIMIQKEAEEKLRKEILALIELHWSIGLPAGMLEHRTETDQLRSNIINEPMEEEHSRPWTPVCQLWALRGLSSEVSELRPGRTMCPTGAAIVENLFGTNTSSQFYIDSNSIR